MVEKHFCVHFFSAFFCTVLTSYAGGEQPVLMKRHEAICVFRNLACWKGPDLSLAAVVGDFFESLKETFPLTPAVG